MCWWQFDDLPENPGGFDPSVDPVGTYKGIYFHVFAQGSSSAKYQFTGIFYQGFVVATQNNSALKYFVIPSEPNIINSGTNSRANFGGSPALQINTGSSKDTFTLKSLRLACLSTNGIYTSNANGCTVLFVGNKRSGAASVTYEYQYPNQNTNPGPGTPLTTFGTVTFPNNFKGLQEVFISLTQVQNDIVGANPLLDNVCLSIQG